LPAQSAGGGASATAGTGGLQAGEPAQAIRLLRDAAALAPDSAPVRTNLALAYLAAGAPRILARASSWAGRCWRWLPSAECIQRFLETEPDDGDARLNLARAHQGAGRWQDALDGYQRVLAACPQDEDAQLRLATGLLALGQLESALRAIQGALQGAPELTVTALKARTTAGRGVGWLNVEMLAAALRGRP